MNTGRGDGLQMNALSWLAGAALCVASCQSEPPSGQAAAQPATAVATPAPAAPSKAAPDTELLAVGAEAPDVSAATQSGEVVALRSLRGQPVVVYFYPKDDTPGCTVEAKGFRDLHAQFEAAGAVVMGVSLDGAASHKSFADKYELPFSLLADTDGAIAKAFGVKTRGGYAQRVTFLVGPDGRIAKVWETVSVGGHAQDVLRAIAAIAAGRAEKP